MMRYNKYKDSGFDWLDQVPSAWKVLRVKDITNKIGSGVTPKGGSEVYVDSGIPLLRSQNVYDDGLRIDDVSYIEEEIHQKMKSSQLKPYDILINITGASIGRTCIVPESLPKANINQHIIFIRTKKSLVPFVSYYFKTNTFKEYINLIQAGSSKEALNMGQTLSTPILMPNSNEQISIANYLDTQTQAIDERVGLLEKKTCYYQNLRKSLINETVTKGLDKNVDLKKNELGFDTPKKWIRYRLKDLGFLFSGLSGKSGDDFNQDDNPDNKGFIPFTNIANNTYLKRDHLGTVVVSQGEKQNKVKKGDIFFLMSSEGYEDIGKSAALAEDIEEIYLNSFCKGYRVNPRKTNPYFLNYLMLSDYYRQLLIVEGKGFTRINLKMEKVNDFLVYIPEVLSVQEEIVKFLDNKLETIAKIITNIQNQIITLKELRKTLINDVVTGKIKVIND
ncbi:restriction endonuclease subunit S [Flavobacterium zepuense]|uniref:Restriction endonuclease subunit S n=1 Tax=Flavobacterium zepuense TaxID=2593302 RepID=A0A552UTK8_9FLAO|nr:restriction endonuclease subunit S [Flavobacterium zepuense]TRW21544.1 restriction endonuclease subunit S [Flavobacterium zepuense]